MSVKNIILQEDLNNIAKSQLPLEKLKNSKVLITGATGLIGSQLVKGLMLYSKENKYNITVLALARNREKAELIFADFIHEQSLVMVYEDIMTLKNIDYEIDYIIHGASVTSSKDFVQHPVETIQTAVNGSINILEIARKKSVKGFVYLSSLEVYGVCDFNLPEVYETDCGNIDILNVRSSYSQSKRMVECLCVSYASEFNVPVKIARLTQTFGAGVQYDDNRVFAQFARCIIEKKDIVLHTKGETVRNYCYTVDAIKGILTILAKGAVGEAYNIANKDTAISIAGMAGKLTETYKESGVKVVFDLSDEKEYGYNPVIKIKLNTDKLELLGWKAEVNLPEMFERLIKSMVIDKS